MKRPLCCVCAAFVAAVFLYLYMNPPVYSYVEEEGSSVRLMGEVCRKEYKNEKLALTLKQVKRLDFGTGNQETINGVICYIKDSAHAVGMEEPKLGSTIAVEGKVSYFGGARNPGGFDAQRYYQALGISYQLYKAEILAVSGDYSKYHETLCQLRRYFEKIFDNVLSPKEASIMKAMLLGNKTELDRDSRQLFQKSGIAHILAISGLHITLLGMGLYKLLCRLRLPRAMAAVMAVLLMTAYGDMAGMGTSAYRAVFMFGMKLLAGMMGRTYDMLTALAAAAVLILAEQPLYIFHSGFLLSFGAVLGIGCLSEVTAPPAQSGRIAASLCGSLSIFLVHFPIMLCTYYEFPVYSFILNLIVIPAMAFVMLGGILCLAFGSVPFMAGQGLAKMAGALCHLLLSAFEQLSSLSLKLPFADWITGRPENWRIVIFFAVVWFLYAAHHYGKKISQSALCRTGGIDIGLPFSVKLITVLVAVAFISSRPINGASVTVLDVGQGDCIWIQSERGENFLIDAGSTSESRVGEYTVIPYLKYMGVSRIDAVFLTHLDSDHISGVMELLGSSKEIDSGIAIGRVCIAGAAIKDEAYEKLEGLCKAKKIPLYGLCTGDRIEAYGLSFEVLHPSKEYQPESRNAYSLVMELEIENFHALFTGDVEADGELAVAGLLGQSGGHSGFDLYKAAHHGSKYSNTKELITKAAPKHVVISCSGDNSYGHPHEQAVQNFKDAGSSLYITKDTGAIMIKIKDGEYAIQTYLD